MVVIVLIVFDLFMDDLFFVVFEDFEYLVVGGID